MLILVFFAFLAGIVTVASPCVLPVLPFLLGAGYTGTRYRAWGIVIGFILCFTLATLTLSQALHSIGVSGGWVHIASALLLALFGLTLILPPLARKFEEWTAPIAALGQKLSTKASSGFWGGVLLGIALGFLWTPCAGPILATIIILTTLSTADLATASLTAAYAIGAALPMLAIMYGSGWIRSAVEKQRALAASLRTLFGILTLAASLAIASGWTESFQQALLDYIPVLEIENNRIVKKRLAKLVHDSVGKSFTLRVDEFNTSPGSALPFLGQAPELPSGDTWLNSRPLTMQDLKGKVVLIDFWTYSCINCLRTIPYLKRWYSNYKDKGLIILGVHSPEFPFEQQTSNVTAAMKRLGITYPVVQDNNFAIWKSYGNLYWPAHYLIDKEGNLRYYHFGEGKYLETENAIRQLLGLEPMTGIEERPRQRAITPEIYLGYSRAQAYPYDFELVKDALHDYSHTDLPGADQITLEGKWILRPDHAESDSNESYINLNFMGTQAYLVLSGNSTQPLEITLDGKPLPKKYYTADMNANGEIYIKEPRKYDILAMKDNYSRYRVRIRIPKGISAYAFTFGDQ